MSKSVTEFWRRWHISLGSWFRDYVYIPLGGNRLGIKRQLLHILVVWMLTGFWHGAEWNFIVWGLFFAILLILEKLWLYPKLQSAKIWSHIYMFFIITVSFVIFHAGSTTEMISDVGNLFLLGDAINAGIVGEECLYYLKSYSLILLIAMAGSTNIPKKWYYKVKENKVAAKVMVVIEPAILLLLLLLSTAYLIDGSFNPFLYFRF